ncbi:energy transducer TonB, partial [Escherichia coli]
MMNILHFSQSVKWSSWFICSLLLHGLIFLAFIWRFSEVQPAMSPAPAIMLQWAEIIEAPSSPLSLPVGIAQQESAVTEEKQQTEDRQQRPVTEDSDATIEITRKKKSSDGEKKKTRPPRKIKAQTSDSRHCCKVSDEAAFCLIQRPYISKTLLT